MFKKEDIESIDRKYFTVIVANEYDITLVSNNTHHVWYIHNVELPDRELCIVFHKHKASHPYHNLMVWYLKKSNKGYQIARSISVKWQKTCS